jgi:hypothetical protein
MAALGMSFADVIPERPGRMCEVEMERDPGMRRLKVPKYVQMNVRSSSHKIPLFAG